MRPAHRQIVLLVSAATLAAVPGCGGSDAPKAPPAAAGRAASKIPPTTSPPASPPHLRNDLASLYRLIQARDTGPARIRLRKVLNQNPDDGQASFLFGLSYHRERRYGLARPYFERAIADAPEYVTSWYFYGWTLYYLGEIEMARTAFETHLRSQPETADSHFAIGLIDLDEDKLDDAAARFRTVLALCGDDPAVAKDRSKARTRLADVHMRRAEFEDAKAELLLATELYPDHYEAFYKLFRVHMRLGETAEAEAAERAFIAARERVRPGTGFPE